MAVAGRPTNYDNVIISDAQGNSVGTNQHTTGDDNIIPTKAQGNSATYLSRRNLHPNGASYLRGKRYLAEVRPEGRPEKLANSLLVSCGPTAERLAAELGATHGRAELPTKFPGTNRVKLSEYVLPWLDLLAWTQDRGGPGSEGGGDAAFGRGWAAN